MKINKYLLCSNLSLLPMVILPIASVSIDIQRTKNNVSNSMVENNIQDKKDSSVSKFTKSTVLTNEIVRNLGWDTKPIITLNDWTTMAPNVSIVGQFAFITFSKVKKIEIPAQIKIFQHGAFQQTGIKEMIFEAGSQLERIDLECFAYSSLVNIQLPSSLKIIGENAFRYSKSINEVTFAPDSQLTTIESKAFDDTSLTKIIVPKSTTTLGSGVFSSTTKLTDISLYYNFKDKASFIGLTAEQEKIVKWLGLEKPDETILTNEVFLHVGWDKKTKISLEDWQTMLPNVTSIQGGFENNNILESLVIPSKITSIGARGITANKLTYLEFQNNSQLVSIGDYGINNTLIESVVIPDSVKTIGAFGLANNNMLKYVTLPNELKVIEKSLFSNSSEIENINIPNSVISINDNAFEGLIKLTNIKIPDSVIKLGNNSFKNTKSLKKIIFEINSQLTIIEEDVFSESSLKSIQIPNSVVFINENSFRNTELNDIKMPLKFQNYLVKFGLSNEQYNNIIWNNNAVNIKFITIMSSLVLLLIIQTVILIYVTKSLNKIKQ